MKRSTQTALGNGRIALTLRNYTVTISNEIQTISMFICMSMDGASNNINNDDEKKIMNSNQENRSPSICHVKHTRIAVDAVRRKNLDHENLSARNVHHEMMFRAMCARTFSYRAL